MTHFATFKKLFLDVISDVISSDNFGSDFLRLEFMISSFMSAVMCSTVWWFQAHRDSLQPASKPLCQESIAIIQNIYDTDQPTRWLLLCVLPWLWWTSSGKAWQGQLQFRFHFFSKISFEMWTILPVQYIFIIENCTQSIPSRRENLPCPYL